MPMDGHDLCPAEAPPAQPQRDFGRDLVPLPDRCHRAHLPGAVPACPLAFSARTRSPESPAVGRPAGTRVPDRREERSGLAGRGVALRWEDQAGRQTTATPQAPLPRTPGRVVTAVPARLLASGPAAASPAWQDPAPQAATRRRGCAMGPEWIWVVVVVGALVAVAVVALRVARRR